MSWLLLSLFAVSCQTVRNGLARSLSHRVSAFLTSWCRFAFALPYALVLVGALMLERGVPRTGGAFYLLCLGTAVTQLSANVALIAAFQRSTYAQSIVLHKLDAVFGALLGVAFFAERPSLLGWAGVLLTTFGMLVINLGRDGRPGSWRRALRPDAGALLSLACAALLALTSFLLKEAVDTFAALNPRVGEARFEGAAHTLFHTTWMEVVLLSVSLGLRAPREFGHVRAYGGHMALVGLTSFLGSLAWFWAFSIALVAYVRAVGQLEAVFAVAVSFYLFRERQVLRQVPGILLIASGITLLLLG